MSQLQETELTLQKPISLIKSDCCASAANRKWRRGGNNKRNNQNQKIVQNQDSKK